MHQLPKFSNISLLRLALTHCSYSNEHRELEDNERLKFLGKTVLSFASSAFLYKLYPEMGEEELTRRRSRLVGQKQLTKFALELGIDKKMRLGTEAVQEGGYQNAKLLSSTFEAIIGAYFLDSGIEAVCTYVKPLFASVVEIVPRSQSIDFKHLFEQWSLFTYGQNPEYFILQESEPDSTKQFTVGACVGGEVLGVGTARSEQAAKKRAAAAVLKKFGLAF
jgi:ribonuclease-3